MLGVSPNTLPLVIYIGIFCYSVLLQHSMSFKTIAGGFNGAFWWYGPEGGTQIWFRRGCAAEAAKPVPIFKGHFGGKGYPLLLVFSQENGVFVYFSDEKGENI